MTTTTKSSTSRRSTYPRPRVLGIKTEVPLFDGKRVRYVNLDSAASTPPLVHVQQAVDRFAPWYSSVHRGAGCRVAAEGGSAVSGMQRVDPGHGYGIESGPAGAVRSLVHLLDILPYRRSRSQGMLSC